MSSIITRLRPDRTSVLVVPCTEELAARFWAKVERTEDCWLWRGRVNPGGTGQMRIAAKSLGAQGGTRIDVHRLSYLWFVGPIFDGYEVDHTCRVSICVRPSHLEMVTPEVNKERARLWRLRDKLRAEILARCRELRAATKAKRA